jgi:hypothetical protein
MNEYAKPPIPDGAATNARTKPAPCDRRNSNASWALSVMDRVSGPADIGI